MSRLFYVALCKPKESKTWTILHWPNSGAVIAMGAARCYVLGCDALPQSVARSAENGNKFGDPDDWEVRVAEVNLCE